MEIYVANATLQHREFYYRRPEDIRPGATYRVLEIPAGLQVQFPGDYDRAAVQVLISQLERSGAVPHDDLGAIQRPHTLVYRVQSVIEGDTIDEAFNSDIDARTTVAADQMEKTGLQAFSATQTLLKQNGMSPASLKETTLEITETTDVSQVTGGVDMEVTVTEKPGRAGKLTRTPKPRRRKS